jgi:hypothetical protein
MQRTAMHSTAEQGIAGQGIAGHSNAAQGMDMPLVSSLCRLL